MSLDYTSLFTTLGILVKHSNLLAADGVNLAADQNEIEEVFEAENQPDKVYPLSGALAGLAQSHWGLRETIAQTFEARLTDVVTVINELNLPSTSTDAVLAAIVRQMAIDGKSVNASVVTVGSVTAASENTGTGTVIVSTILDGVNSPGSGLITFPELSGQASQLSRSETVTIRITDDSYADGRTTHRERAECHGDLPGTSLWAMPEGGSGQGPILGTTLAGNLLTNGDLQSFASNVPTGWNVVSGTAGTHFALETTQVDLGDASLEFTVGNASLAQFVSLTPDALYLLAIRYKAASTTTSGKKLICRFAGTGYSPGPGDKIEITGDNFATSWTDAYVWTVVPRVLPGDLRVVIESSGTLDVNVWVDSVQVVSPTWHNGVAIALLPGSTPFVRGDSWTFTLANDGGGLFQEFFRKRWGMQLPSKADGSETIDDDLAD